MWFRACAVISVRKSQHRPEMSTRRWKPVQFGYQDSVTQTISYMLRILNVIFHNVADDSSRAPAAAVTWPCRDVIARSRVEQDWSPARTLNEFSQSTSLVSSARDHLARTGNGAGRRCYCPHGPHTHTHTWPAPHVFTIRYDTRCYFNVRSKADISQLNLPHGTDN